jgi:23S rRNA pseudouridine1911/1915/1917 synthase
MSDLEHRIIYEDNHLIVINKRSGELVQGDKTGDTPLLESLKDLIKARDKKPGAVFLGAPHRIDRPVSGIVIFAKTSKALSRMSDIFRRKAIQKTYWAITEKAPTKPQGRLIGWMKKNEKQNKSYVKQEETSGYKEAVLNYSLKVSSERYHLIEVDLETGRHHQIRAQLADMGCIIKGDLKYGASRSNPDASISLHARLSKFEHPVKKELLELTAPCPDDKLWSFFEEQLA